MTHSVAFNVYPRMEALPPSLCPLMHPPSCPQILFDMLDLKFASSLHRECLNNHRGKEILLYRESQWLLTQSPLLDGDLSHQIVFMSYTGEELRHFGVVVREDQSSANSGV